MLVQAQCLTWVRDAGIRVSETGRIGVAEYSTLGVKPGCRLDSLDVHNAKTGRTVHFERTAEIRDLRENELVADVFTASKLDVARYPHLAFSKLHLFND